MLRTRSWSCSLRESFPNEVVYLQYRQADLSSTQSLLLRVYGLFVVWTVFHVGICGTLRRRILSLEPLSVWKDCFSDSNRSTCVCYSFSQTIWQFMENASTDALWACINCDYDVEGGVVVGEGEIRSKGFLYLFEWLLAFRCL